LAVLSTTPPSGETLLNLFFHLILLAFFNIQRYHLDPSRSTDMKEFTQTQISELSEFVESDRFSTGQSNRELHLHDISPHYGSLPAGIIWPLTTEEVAGILSWTYQNDCLFPKPGG
jgi:hypothetical protein